MKILCDSIEQMQRILNKFCPSDLNPYALENCHAGCESCWKHCGIELILGNRVPDNENSEVVK